MAPDRSLREFRLDRLVRAFELTSTLDFNVVLAEDSSLVSPFVREFVAAACQPGLDLRVRWIAWSGLSTDPDCVRSSDRHTNEKRHCGCLVDVGVKDRCDDISHGLNPLALPNGRLATINGQMRVSNARRAESR